MFPFVPIAGKLIAKAVSKIAKPLASLVGKKIGKALRSLVKSGIRSIRNWIKAKWNDLNRWWAKNSLKLARVLDTVSTVTGIVGAILCATGVGAVVGGALLAISAATSIASGSIYVAEGIRRKRKDLVFEGALNIAFGALDVAPMIKGAKITRIVKYEDEIVEASIESSSKLIKRGFKVRLGRFGNKFKGALRRIFSGGKRALKKIVKLGEGIKRFAKRLIKAISNKRILKRIGTILGKRIRSFGKRIIETLGKILKRMGTSAKNLLQSIGRAIGRATLGLGKRIKRFIGKIFRKIRKIFGRKVSKDIAKGLLGESVTEEVILRNGGKIIERHGIGYTEAFGKDFVVKYKGEIYKVSAKFREDIMEYLGKQARILEDTLKLYRAEPKNAKLWHCIVGILNRPSEAVFRGVQRILKWIKSTKVLRGKPFPSEEIAKRLAKITIITDPFYPELAKKWGRTALAISGTKVAYKVGRWALSNRNQKPVKGKPKYLFTRKIKSLFRSLKRKTFRLIRRIRNSFVRIGSFFRRRSINFIRRAKRCITSLGRRVKRFFSRIRRHFGRIRRFFKTFGDRTRRFSGWIRRHFRRWRNRVRNFFRRFRRPKFRRWFRRKYYRWKRRARRLRRGLRRWFRRRYYRWRRRFRRWTKRIRSWFRRWFRRR